MIESKNDHQSRRNCEFRRAIAAAGRCRRVYGGALPLLASSVPMSVRMDTRHRQKQALAQTAATMIEPGEFIFLDSGSTNLALIDFLPKGYDLTLATNSIDIAGAALRRQDLKLIMLGGTVDLAVGGCVDATAIGSLAQMNIDRSFIGVCSVSPTFGLSAFDIATLPSSGLWWRPADILSPWLRRIS
ncbi:MULTISPECIES: DeoR/GlpR family DNA-binding transcription regulator [Mesorhizobium]|uniref:DeoR/GlpR family DNA-binding transcription regulator n=1 Tax=Mesorhizobium TaxID=68287 RepID=UPI0018C87D53|nr:MULTISPECIES: DeoR/GlpR family DNA-binding transcription regulator [Mesorhizobium]